MNNEIECPDSPCYDCERPYVTPGDDGRTLCDDCRERETRDEVAESALTNG